jgi:putative ABC transport system substrate-binding protein
VNLAVELRLPAIYDVREFVESGGLISYGPSLLAMQRRSAIYIDKIFKGAKPGDLPIEQPTVFELVVNMKTARALGIKIPQSILVRADKVIE